MKDPLQFVLAAFQRVNLVALGERHWAHDDSHFRLALIQHPAFPQQVNCVVVEFANPRYQALLDRFVSGDSVPAEEIQRVWRDTTQPAAFDPPVYGEFFHAMRAVNAKLPAQARVRVVAGDFPIDWSAVLGPSDLEGAMRGRDPSAAAVIQREVLDRKQKAVVLFGSTHLYRHRPETIVDLLREDHRAKWFIVVPVGGPGLPATIAANAATANDPSLLWLAKQPAVASLPARDVLEIGTKRIKIVDGRPLFQEGKPVFVPVFEEDVRVGDLADACLYFGAAEPEFVPPPPGLYDHSEYGVEVQRRRRLLSLATPPQ